MKTSLCHLGVVFVASAVTLSTVHADWKSDANASIEQIRKRDWTIQINSTNGQPAAGVTVAVRQRRREFAFGCALNADALINQPRYGDFFARNFEWVVFENETKWTLNESTQGQLDYRRADLMAAFGRKQALRMRGHTVFWEATGGGYEHPAWLDALSSNQLSSAVSARMNSVVPRYRGYFEHWDINNELLHGNFFRARLGTGVVPLMFQTTAKLDPTIKLFVNDYNVIAGFETDSYRQQINQLLSAGAAITGVGVQGHFGNQIIDPVVVKARLDNLSTPRIPIWVTEYDSVSANATTRADNLEKLYRVAFAHTNVQGVLMWGFWANAHWLGADAAIVDANWTVNAAGQRYTNLMSEWTTVTNGITDANGRVTFRGFRGDYDVTLSVGAQSITTQSVVLASGVGAQSNLLTLDALSRPVISEVLIGETMSLHWKRLAGARSCLVESSTNLSQWEIISPRLDPVATAWSVKLTNGAPHRLFRVRSDSQPPPDMDFYEATGAKRTATINGNGTLTTADNGLIHRNFFLFSAPDLRNGVFSFTEDNTEASPNGGPPGTFRFSIDTKPTTVGQDYWGFILRPGSVVEWPASSLATTNLAKTRLRFRYKLTAGRAINIRVEPASGGYNERCDFGNITGNGTWQEFNQPLSIGSNGTAFLNFLNAGGERYLNLVCGSGAGLASYAAGNTFTLDDISIYYEP